MRHIIVRKAPWCDFAILGFVANKYLQQPFLNKEQLMSSGIETEEEMPRVKRLGSAKIRIGESATFT